MSKLTLIEGSNVTSIADDRREVKLLELEIDKKADPTNKDRVTYAYHFLRLGRPVLAQKQLNAVSSGYFDIMIYKDLFQAMLAWSLIQTRTLPPDSESHRQYEYFLIVKRSLELFDLVNFNEKPGFYRFRRDFQRNSEALTKL